ncbi:MAG: trehalose-6-phosphate synthase [Actinomycetota bacterium]|nr:trehalose-6-phosphate synthase [Actinomycetota bacterium]
MTGNNQGEETEDPRVERIRELLQGRHLIIASNRGPVEFHTGEDGEIHPQRGGGGLVTALDVALEAATNATWVASAITPEDEVVSEQAGGPFMAPTGGPACQIRLIPIGDRAFHRYYNIISNLLLWFMQHYLWDIPHWPNIDETTHVAFGEGYRVVNQLFARNIADIASRTSEESIVMLQDYHLYLCASYLRQEMPSIKIEHFTHIPWCQPDYLRLLPPYMRDEIIEGLLACDVVSFQTSRYARNFLWSCKELTPHEVDIDGGRVKVGKKEVLVTHHPISIDARELSATASSEEINHWRKNLSAKIGRKKKILRVDRVEFSKNILRGFEVFRRFLDLYHEWWGKVVFINYLYPSRMSLAKYRNYLAEIREEVERLNDEFSTKRWEPVLLRVEDNYPQSIAALCDYDVLFVNSLFDGMNLVSKEGAVVNENNGVIILSENAGSYSELADWVIPISPLDTEGSARAINEALLMPEEEKAAWAGELKRAVSSQSAEDWLIGQLEDMEKAKREM